MFRRQARVIRCFFFPAPRGFPLIPFLPRRCSIIVGGWRELWLRVLSLARGFYSPSATRGKSHPLRALRRILNLREPFPLVLPSPLYRFTICSSSPRSGRRGNVWHTNRVQINKRLGWPATLKRRLVGEKRMRKRVADEFWDPACHIDPYFAERTCIYPWRFHDFVHRT